MIVDTSVIVAILLREPEADSFIDFIGVEGNCKIAAPTLLETSMVLAGRHGLAILEKLDAYLSGANVETVAFTADHAAIARQAFLRFGKGRHPAGLNYGDCISYAVAKLEAMPLLFKGNDFNQTDIESAF
jgi:ribonuclease VapC